MTLHTYTAIVLFWFTSTTVTIFYGPCNTSDVLLTTVDDGNGVTHELQVDSKNFSTYRRYNNVSWTELGQRDKNWTVSQMFALQALLAKDIKSKFIGTPVIVSFVYVLNPLRTFSNRLLCINDTLVSNHTNNAASYWEPSYEPSKNIVDIIRNYTESEKNYTIHFKISELLDNATLNCTCTNPKGVALIRDRALNCTCRNSTAGHVLRPVTHLRLGGLCGTVYDNTNIPLSDSKNETFRVQNVALALIFTITISVLVLVVCRFFFREQLRMLVDRYIPSERNLFS